VRGAGDLRRERRGRGRWRHRAAPCRAGRALGRGRPDRPGRAPRRVARLPPRRRDEAVARPSPPACRADIGLQAEPLMGIRFETPIWLLLLAPALLLTFVPHLAAR